MGNPYADSHNSPPHPTPQRSEGWRLKKRPGVEYLFRSLLGRYEIVLFTCEVPFVAEPVIAQLDPERFIMYHLYRDSTKYINGQHVKARREHTLSVHTPPSIPPLLAGPDQPQPRSVQSDCGGHRLAFVLLPSFQRHRTEAVGGTGQGHHTV